MQRRAFLGALALTPFWPKLMEAQMPAKSIFRLSDPVEALRRYAEIAHSKPPLPQLNAQLAALAVEDPVAFWLASVAAIPAGQASDPAQDPALRTDQTLNLFEEIWDEVGMDDIQRIRSVHEQAQDYPLDSFALGMKLADNWGQWFEAEAFFDQIEAVSSALPAIAPRDPFDAWKTWALITQQISFALGYAGHRPPEQQGQSGDAAARLPYLFQREYDQSTIIAQRFEASPVDDNLLMSWLYAPSLEVYLAYGPLPERLPAKLGSASPRLAKAYAALNARQMAEFAEAEDEMLE